MDNKKPNVAVLIKIIRPGDEDYSVFRDEVMPVLLEKMRKRKAETDDAPQEVQNDNLSDNLKMPTKMTEEEINAHLDAFEVRTSQLEELVEAHSRGVKAMWERHAKEEEEAEKETQRLLAEVERMRQERQELEKHLGGD